MARTKSSTLNLRIDPVLKEAAEKAAAEERRSLTSYIEKLIQDDLKAREAAKPRRPAKRKDAPQ